MQEFYKEQKIMNIELKEITIQELSMAFKTTTKMELLVLVASWTFVHLTNENLFTKTNKEML
jgi:hypothetical protein